MEFKDRRLKSSNFYWYRRFISIILKFCVQVQLTVIVTDWSVTTADAMKVLVVNCFEESPVGASSFGCFYRIVSTLLSESFLHYSDVSKPDLICRKYDNLKEYVLNWEIDILNDTARVKARSFDQIDLICICGDMKILPWDRKCYQVVNLLNMALKTFKPVLSCSGAAFFSTFIMGTSGVRCEVINHPFGDKRSKLRTYPFYSKGLTLLSSTWLDNELGDLYTYNTDDKYWKPVCNIGFFRSVKLLREI